MGDRKLTVELDAAAVAMIDKVVGEGRFTDGEAVLRFAMMLFAHWEREQQEGLDDPEEDWDELFDEALRSGEPIEATDAFYEDVKRRGRERLAATRAAAE